MGSFKIDSEFKSFEASATSTFASVLVFVGVIIIHCKTGESSLKLNVYLFGSVYIFFASILLHVGTTQKIKSLLLPWLLVASPIQIGALIHQAINFTAPDPSSVAYWCYIFVYIFGIPWAMLVFISHTVFVIRYYCKLKNKETNKTSISV